MLLTRDGGGIPTSILDCPYEDHAAIPGYNTFFESVQLSICPLLYSQRHVYMHAPNPAVILDAIP